MTTPKKALVGAVALVILGTSFVLGGRVSYNQGNHRLSMAAGATAQVNCNGAGLTFRQLQPTIGGLECAPFPPSSTTTTIVPGSSTTVTPPTTVPPPETCPLTIAGRQCWAAKTGVPGLTEAQITAGGTPLVHTVGDRTITQDGTIIDGQWIDGCLSIHASNVTIRNSLIRTSNWCSGGDNQSGPAAINMGACHAASPTNLQIIDSEVDAGNVPPGGTYTGMGACNFTLTRANVHGGHVTIWAGHNVTITDSFIHDPSNAASPNHLDGVNVDSGDHVTISHNWISTITTPRTDWVNSGLSLNNSWGPAQFITVRDNFLEGGVGTDVNFGGGLTSARPWGNAHDVTFVGNRLSPNTAYGVQFFYGWTGTNPNMVWIDNRQSETLAPINPS